MSSLSSPRRMDGQRAWGRLGDSGEEVTRTSWEQGRASPGFHKCHRMKSLKKMHTFYPRIPLLEIYPKEQIIDVNIYLKDVPQRVKKK